MIMPLLALEENQKLAIKKMQVNSNPCILNDKTMTKDLLNKIQSGIFIHVFISSEIVILNKNFWKIFIKKIIAALRFFKDVQIIRKLIDWEDLFYQI